LARLDLLHSIYITTKETVITFFASLRKAIVHMTLIYCLPLPMMIVA